MLAASTTFKPALRGHVTSIFKNQPVQTTITYSPKLFTHGEASASRARDGRYAVWLPLGTHTVKFEAKGFHVVTQKVKVTAYDNPQTIDVRMIPILPQPTLTRSGTDSIGTTTTLTYASPGDVGETSWVLLSRKSVPGIAVGAGRVVPLDR